VNIDEVSKRSIEVSVEDTFFIELVPSTVELFLSCHFFNNKNMLSLNGGIVKLSYDSLLSSDQENHVEMQM